MTVPSSPEPWKWDAVEVARAIAAREVSSREVVQACLERLETVNPLLNAVVASFPEEAFAAAEAADLAVARKEPLGPLHGVPVTIKDNVDQAGAATTNGVVAWKDTIAEADSPSVASLRSAGAIILGRTNTSSMSLRWTSENDLHGLTLNPWSAEHTAGGSSGGAGVAVAAGIGPVAHANDLFGSIRFPAFCTGTVGLRPSWGRTPFFNGTSKEERGLAFQTMAVQGPIVRRVRDLKPALAALCRFDPRDPWCIPMPLQWQTAGPVRIALSVDPVGAGTHPAIVRALREAVEILVGAGFAVEEADPPDASEAALLGEDIIMTETRVLTAALVNRLADAPMRRQLELTLARRKPLDIEGYVRALARRATIMRRWALFSERFPILLCPTTTQPPYRLGNDIASQSALDELYRAQAMLFVVPLVGAPSLTLPTGTVDGLPIGVQMIGRRFGEDMLIRAAEILEPYFAMPTPIDPILSPRDDECRFHSAV